MKKTLQLIFLFILIVQPFQGKIYSQIVYIDDLNGSQFMWGENQTFLYDYEEACDGVGLLGNPWMMGDIPVYSHIASQSIGVSDGTPIEFSYDYKLLTGWFTGEYLPLENTEEWGVVMIQYAQSQAGPWLDVDVINPTNHIPSASCVTKNVTFTPPVGPVYLRIIAQVYIPGNIGYHVLIDNISAIQGPLCETSAPVITAPIYICENLTFADIYHDGNQLVLYNSSVGFEPIPSTTSLATYTNAYLWAAQIEDGCESPLRTGVNIRAIATDAPTGDDIQQFAANSAVLGDIEVTATGTLKYYNSHEDAENRENDLSASVIIPEGINTYYITQTINECESPPFAVIIETSLSAGTHGLKGFMYSPNPVSDVLNLSYTQEISSVEIYNMIGQLVLVTNIGQTEGQVDTNRLSAGTYTVKVTSGGDSKTIKVVKK